jgi:phosphatidylserine decarboxylase
MDEPKLIEGEYYTVNPMAIRSALDVYGENIRVIVPINSEKHGRVMVVCVGAMMVGSTVITRKKGEHVKRAEELGYFKFGMSSRPSSRLQSHPLTLSRWLNPHPPLRAQCHALRS